MWIEVVGWDDATGYSQWMPLPDAQTKQTER